jgi:hypothetical protein
LRTVRRFPISFFICSVMLYLLSSIVFTTIYDFFAGFRIFDKINQFWTSDLRIFPELKNLNIDKRFRWKLNWCHGTKDLFNRQLITRGSIACLWL